MSNIIDLPLVGQSYHLKDWAIDCQRTINLYPQVIESGNTPNVSALIPTEGLISRYTFSGAVRGLYALNDRALVVAGTKLYKIQNNTTTEIGVISGTDLVTFADDSINILITGADTYTYKISDNSLTKLLINDDTGFFGATSVTFLDSRFIWTVPNSGRIQWSNILNTATTALNYATAESKSDNLIRVIASNGQLWLLGEKTTEIWNSTSSIDLPYQRMSGAYIPVGCLAKNSVATFGSSLIWLAQTDHGDGQIVMTEGYQTRRISNHCIESEISTYSKIDDAYAFSYQQNGHGFYVISFPTVKKTWAFDSTTQMWHERSFYNIDTTEHEHHRAQVHCFFNGEHLVGDRSNGKVYRLSGSAQTDDGAVIMRERITPCLKVDGSRFVFNELEIDAQVGQDDDSEPLLMLDWSDDKGRTWSNIRMNSLGKIGEYEKRIIFRRLGQSRSRVFRLRMTDAGRLILLGAKLRIS